MSKVIKWPTDRHGKILDSLTKMGQSMATEPFIDRIDELDTVSAYLDSLSNLSAENQTLCITGVMLAQLLRPALDGLNDITKELNNNVTHLKKIYLS